MMNMFELVSIFLSPLQEMLSLTGEMMSLAVRVWSLGITLILQLLILLAFLLMVLWCLLKLCACNLRRGEAGFLHVAFFHPYCNAGGGGERVLWCAIRTIQKKYPKAKCYIYSGDTDATSEEIVEKAHQRFNVVLPRPVEFIFLRSRNFVEAHHYPYFTLFMQSIGSIVLGGEALSKFRPDILMDTMGYAFTYPLFRYIGGCVIGSYVHYPTISTDMLRCVSEQTTAFNNQDFIARSAFFSTLKIGYYYLFALAYGIVGRCAHLSMVNSSWTYGHIKSLWGQNMNTFIVYPPCDTENFRNLPLIADAVKIEKLIVSIGQFRPEKNHSLQLHAFKRLLEIVDPVIADKIKLVMIGGCRNNEDNQRVNSLKLLAAELNVLNKIYWKINAPYSSLVESVQNGTIGLHTMWNEHFGICLVECMAGGLIMVGHDSGGPKLDIIVDYQGNKTGFLASDVESYAQSLKSILAFTDLERDIIRNAARESVVRFSDDQFETTFNNACDTVFTSFDSMI